MSEGRKSFHVYHSETVLGWRIIRKISFDAGESKVAQGVWRRVNDELGNHIGYQILSAAAHRVDLDLPSRPQPVSITAAQSELNAYTVFTDGSSRTAGMTEERRMERAARGLDPEDEVERLQMKISVFKKLGAARGDIIRVWPLDRAEPVGV
jgi:hypothetical protein